MNKKVSVDIASMDPKNMAALIAGSVVCVVVFSALLIPIVSEATTTEKTFENEGFYYMQKISADDVNTYSLAYEYDSGTYTFKYNDEVIDITSIGTLATTLATDGESWVVRGQFNEYVGLQSVGTNFTSGGHNVKSSVYTFNQGTASVVAVNTSDVSTTKTTTYDELWIYSPTPTDYVMKKATSNAYLLESSEYFAMGITSITNWENIIKITGNVEEFTPTIMYPTNITTTVTNKEIHSTTVSGYVGLTALEKLTFTINDGTTTVDATYSYFIVPASVTAELTVHPDAATLALLSVLPIIAMIGIILAVVGAFVVSRNDY